MTPESLFVYVLPGTGSQGVKLPASASAPQKPWPAYVRFDDRGKDKEVIATIDTDSSKLLEAAWERAADAITCRPPACPVRELEDIWPDWCRAVVHMAIRPGAARLEELAWDVLGEDLAARRRAAGELFARIRSPAGPSECGRAELARLFVWDRRLSRDTRPGLLEARWLHWDVGQDATFSVHVSHPAAVPVTVAYHLPKNFTGDAAAMCHDLARREYRPHHDHERPGRVAIAVPGDPIPAYRPTRPVADSCLRLLQINERLHYPPPPAT
jgi:hypothetical protein